MREKKIGMKNIITYMTCVAGGVGVGRWCRGDVYKCDGGLKVIIRSDQPVNPKKPVCFL